MVMQGMDVFEELDLIDYDIRVFMDEICRISGIELNRFDHYFLLRQEEPFVNLKSTILRINEMLESVLSGREDIIKNMEKSLSDTKADIDSLQRTARLNSQREYFFDE